jgi:hypothetical protein
VLDNEVELTKVPKSGGRRRKKKGGKKKKIGPVRGWRATTGRRPAPAVRPEIQRSPAGRRPVPLPPARTQIYLFIYLFIFLFGGMR